MNDQYRGISDGHQASYRGQFAENRYLAFELEINQRLVAASPVNWRAVQKAFTSSLRTALATVP